MPEEIENFLRLLALTATRWIQQVYHVSFFVAALIAGAIFFVAVAALALAARVIRRYSNRDGQGTATTESVDSSDQLPDTAESKRRGRGAVMKKADFIRQTLAWGAIMAALSHLMHPALPHNIEERFGLEMPWLPDLFWFALAFGVAMTFLTNRLAGLASAVWAKFLSDVRALTAFVKYLGEDQEFEEEQDDKLEEEHEEQTSDGR